MASSPWAKPPGERGKKPSDCWRTPAWIWELALRALGGRIDWDPCPGVLPPMMIPAPPSNTEDGLTYDWPDAAGKSLAAVYCNPPWSDAGPWAAKLAGLSRQGRVRGLLCTHAAVSAKWWKEHVWHGAAAVCFLYKRPAFIDLTGKPIHGLPRDVALTFYADRNTLYEAPALEVLREVGHVCQLRK